MPIGNTIGNTIGKFMKFICKYADLIVETQNCVFTSGYDPYDFELLIFNRWGEIIWKSHDDNIGWDGTYGAGQKLVQDGIYTWRIEFKKSANDQRVLVTGHVSLIR